MSNTPVEAAFQRSVAAFKNPMLDLLHGRLAPFVVTALSVVFTPDRPTVAVADAHIEVGEVLDQLRAAVDGDDDSVHLPAGGGRELCRHWVKVGWLMPQLEDDVEVYRLSAHAVGALEIAGRVGGRTRVTTSRVRTLLDAVEHLSETADPDPRMRIRRLRAERDELEAEIARVERGEAIARADDEQLLEEAENVLHLARELPADFARVAESIKAMQRDVVTDLRQDIRPTGDVLREYLQRGQQVMESTPEGRAFSGALRLIGDPERIDNLTDQLSAVLRQPFVGRMNQEQRAELAAIARRVEQGVQEVLTAQRRASHVITTQVRTHDPIRDRQVDDLLRDVMAGFHQWMQRSHRGEIIDPLRSFPVADVGHLRQNLGDIRPAGGPDPLPESDVSPDLVPDDSRSWGGPHYEALEGHLASVEGASFDLASLFAQGPDDARRPVDLLGLLELAHRNGMTETEDVSVVEARRPDGTSRRFAFGTVIARTTPGEQDE